MNLIHYIIVRRDLPFGTTLAQVAHAAAESNNLAGHCTVAVLGIKNIKRLRKLEYKLRALGISHVPIREPDAPWNGQLTAIGVVPGDREKLGPIFDDLATYKEFGGVKWEDLQFSPLP